MLAWAACTAIQRLREEQDFGNQIAVELSAFGRAELAATVIKRCTAGAPANSAGERIDRYGGERRHKASPGAAETARRERRAPGAVRPWQARGLQSSVR